MNKYTKLLISLIVITISTIAYAASWCIIWESEIWSCDIWWQASSVQDHSSETWETVIIETVSTWSITLDTWVTEIILSDTQTLDISSWTNTWSSTVEQVSWITIQQALNDKTTWWFTDSDVKKVTFNSWTPSEPITITTTDSHSVEIPDSTTVFAPPSWDWIIHPPTDVSISTPAPSGRTLRSAIVVWSITWTLIFDEMIKVTISWVSNWSVYYSTQNWSKWTRIDTTCNNWNSIPTNLSFPNECYYKDTINNNITVWTYHFTEFWVFIETATWWYINTEVQMEVTPDVISIIAPDTIDFQKIEITNSTWQISIDLADIATWTTITWSLIAWSYFWVDDLKWHNSWYALQIQAEDLVLDTNTWVSINRNNIKIDLYWSWSVFLLNSLTNQSIPPQILVPTLSDAEFWDFGLTMISRTWSTTPSAWMVWMYWIQPTFRIYIPKYQVIWSYTARLILTLYDYWD